MASYYIDIIDTLSLEDKLVLKFASRGGMTLSWKGGDEKDELGIVGSNFSFDMLDEEARDAYFIGLFTGDERQFKVFVKNGADDSVIWQGHLVPDLYSEPWHNGVIFVNFIATDGLGRLKGKYLPAEFYSREKSLIEIFTNILLLTGLEMDLYFAPAIENFLNKDWNTIFIDTATFVSKEKKLDAYVILEKLLKDTLCVCYQADSRWYIEGYNMRMLREVSYKIYDTAAVLKSTLKYNRVLKQVKSLLEPTVTIIPPYNEILVSHERIAPGLPKTIARETNDGWAVATGVVDKIQATAWMGHGTLDIECSNPDYDCILYSQSHFSGGANIDYPYNATRYVSLREKLFFAKGQKVKFNLEFKVKKLGSTTLIPTDLSLWKNPFRYEILFNNVVIYDNFTGIVSDQENVIFEDSGNSKTTIEHIFSEDGLLDIKFWQVPGRVDIHKINGVVFSNISVEVIGFKEEQKIIDLINGDFTVDKDLELDYADDKSGFSKAFRLAKLKEETTAFRSYEVPVLYGFSLDGKNYSVVPLYGANLIKENLYQVFRSALKINVLDVIYNFNDGEQMVVQTQALYASGSFTVKKYAVDDVVDSRKHWLQWTDAFYKIENLSYAQIVANIYRRMFNVAHEKIDLVACNAVKFNDVVLFDYQYVKDFILLNCSWNIDQNKTTITLGRSLYKNDQTDPGDTNIPPIVLAGEDIYINDGVTTVNLSATAFDPDGYILSQIWTKITGGPGDVIEFPTALTTPISNLTEDLYTYQIQVTDNDGATAVDTVNVIRNKTFSVDLVLIDSEVDPDIQRPFTRKKYQFIVTPEITTGFVLQFSGVIQIHQFISGTYGVDGYAEYNIVKNGALIETKTTNPSESVINKSYALNYIAGDVITIELITTATAGDSGSGDTATTFASVSVAASSLVTGTGTVTGPPISKNQTVSVS